MNPEGGKRRDRHRGRHPDAPNEIAAGPSPLFERHFAVKAAFPSPLFPKAPCGAKGGHPSFVPAGTGPPYKTIRPGTRRSVVRAIRLRPCGTYAAAGISHSSGFRRAQPSRAAAAPSTNINQLASYLFFKRYPAFTFHKPHRAPGRPSYTPPPSALSTGKEEKPMRPDAGSQSRTTAATNDSREKFEKRAKKP